MSAETLTGEVTDLLQQLIRNRCVNDGTRESGEESRNADLLRDSLDGCGVDLERYEPVPGRASLVARLEGADPTAPSLALMGHTDVVPVNPDGWERDPFGGELVGGEIWGRGAVDMFNLTASMAVTIRRLAESGFRPRGTLLYVAVADEEALGTHGAKWLVDNEWDAVRCDYLVTEFGGFRLPLPLPGGPRLPVMVAEKGTAWCWIRVRGTPGHGSSPYRTDNAVVKAAEIVRRIAEYQPEPTIHDAWRTFVGSLGLPPEGRDALLDPAAVKTAYESGDLAFARLVYSCTHTTLAPTIARGGVKHNVIPDTAEIAVDVRTLPGHGQREVEAMILEAAGDLADSVTVEFIQEENPASSSPPDSPLREALQRTSGRLVRDAQTIPFFIVGATDARFWRRKGTTAYGYGLFSDRVPMNDFAAMFHGDNERVDQESLRLCAELWDELVREMLG